MISNEYKIQFLIDQIFVSLQQQECEKTDDVIKIFEEKKAFFTQLSKLSSQLDRCIRQLNGKENEETIRILNKSNDNLQSLIEEVRNQVREGQKRSFDELREELPNLSSQEQAQQIACLPKKFIRLDVLKSADYIPENDIRIREVVREVVTYNRLMKQKKLQLTSYPANFAIRVIKLDTTSPFFDYLSNDIIQRIFSYLNLKSLKNIPLVCQNWLALVETMQDFICEKDKKKVEAIQKQPVETPNNPLENDMRYLDTWLKDDVNLRNEAENKRIFCQLTDDSQKCIIQLVCQELMLEPNLGDQLLAQEALLKPDGFLTIENRKHILTTFKISLQFKLVSPMEQEEGLTSLEDLKELKDSEEAFTRPSSPILPFAEEVFIEKKYL